MRYSICLYGVLMSAMLISRASAFDFCDEASVSPTNPSDCKQWARMSCNVECAKCSTVEVTVPPNYTVTGWKAEVKDEQNPSWVENADVIGYSSWERKTGKFDGSGMFKGSATLKNGSGDRYRQIRLCVSTK